MGTIQDQLGSALMDRWRLEREIGRGGMAMVSLAQDLKHRRRVALKVVKPEPGFALGAERFLRHEPTDAIFRAHVVRRLGELYESMGDARNAARYLREFVSLWERTDPDLQPQVAEARRRLARLAEREPAQRRP